MRADIQSDILAKANEILQGGVATTKRRRKKADRDHLPKYPIASYSLGGMAKDAGELAEKLRRSGVPTEVTPAGDPIIRSDAHRREVARVIGLQGKSDFFSG
jgi:hypothetical protein